MRFRNYLLIRSTNLTSDCDQAPVDHSIISAMVWSHALLLMGIRFLHWCCSFFTDESWTSNWHIQLFKVYLIRVRVHLGGFWYPLNLYIIIFDIYAYSWLSLQLHCNAQSFPWNPSGQGLHGLPSNDSKPFKHSVETKAFIWYRL